MSSTPEPTPGTPTDPNPKARRKRAVLRDSLLLLVPILVVLGGAGAYLYWGVYLAVGTVEIPEQLRRGVSLSVADKLDEAFSADGDTLVAAPPADAAKWLDPETLEVGVLDDVSDPKTAKVWEDFRKRLEEKINQGEQKKKAVELVRAPVGASEAAREVNTGKLHVLALTTGAVPWAVNKAGVIPFAVPADDQGNFGYHVEILVRSDSPIKELKDLRGRKIHFGGFSSLSSFKAPLVTLWEKEKLLPKEPGEKDGYQFAVTTSRDAIRGLIWGDCEVVAVASDFLARIEAEEKEQAIKEGKEYPKAPYRSIYKSDVKYPPFCFAHAHDLKPELAKKVREAFTSFRFAGTGLEAAYAKANQTRFVPVTYKKDWEEVRKLDQRLVTTFEQK